MRAMTAVAVLLQHITVGEFCVFPWCSKAMNSAFVRILFGIVSAAIGALLQWLLWPQLHSFPFFSFYPTVILASLIGGLYSGIAATVISTAACAYFFLLPVQSFSFRKPEDWGVLLFFLSFGFAVTAIIHVWKKRTRTLSESEETFRVMFNETPNLAWIAGPDGSIFLYNQRWYEFTGTTAEQMKSLSYFAFCDTETGGAVIEQWRTAVNTARAFAMEFQLRGATGEFRWFLTRATPLKDSQGRVDRWFGTNTDIHELKMAEKERAMLAAIVTSSNDAIISKDLNGIIKSWNIGAQNLFGFTAEEAIGQSIEILIPPERMYEETAILGHIRAGKQVAHFESIRVTKDHRVIDVSLTTSPIWDSQGRIVGASKIVRNIGETKRKELELIQAKEVAENASIARARFLDMAAHELRTPVAAFSALLQFSEMKLEKGNPVDSATLKRLRFQAERLSRLVVDLLDVSRLERGTLKLKVEDCDLVSVLAECIENFKLQTPSRSFKFSCVEKNIEIKIDHIRIYQIISNFIDNAIKYTPEQTPIEVQAELGPESVRVSVKDFGPGISVNRQAALFSPFARGAGDQEERTAGLGLGLYICRRIIELHGGRIGVKSFIDSGSTFFFELPRDISKRLAS